jgi:hypothetical protein
MTLTSIATLLQDPKTRARMKLIGKLENEIHSSSATLGTQYADGLMKDTEVQRAIRVQITLWTDEHVLTQQERLHLFRTAHRVAGVPQF